MSSPPSVPGLPLCWLLTVALGTLEAGPGDARDWRGAPESIGSIDQGWRPGWRWDTGGSVGAGFADPVMPEKSNGAGEDASEVLETRALTGAMFPLLGPPVDSGYIGDRFSKSLDKSTIPVTSSKWLDILENSTGSGYVKEGGKLALPWIALGSLGPPEDGDGTKTDSEWAFGLPKMSTRGLSMLGFGGLSESSDSVPISNPRICSCLFLDGTASFHSLRWTDWAVSPGFCLCHTDDKGNGFFGVGLEFPGSGCACVAGGLPWPLGVEECPACLLPRGPASPLTSAHFKQPCLAFLLERPFSPGRVLSRMHSRHHFLVAFAGPAVFEGVCLSDGGRHSFLP